MKRILSIIIAVAYLLLLFGGISINVAALESIVAVTASFSEDGTSISGGRCVTDAGTDEKGLTLLGGEKYWKESSGMYMWRTIPSSANLGVVIDRENETLIKTDERQSVFLKVTYSGVCEGWYFIRYKNRNGEVVETEIVGIAQEDETQYQDYIFELKDFDWDSNISEPDFRICTTKYEEAQLSHQNNSPNYSIKDVYIKSIELFSNGTFRPFELNVTSDNTGNIFFDNELAEFDVSIHNVTETKNLENAKLTYNIYNFDEKMNRGTAIKSTNTNISVMAGENFTQTIAVEMGKYGLYCLEVVIEHQMLGGVVKKDILFSKCLSNDELNMSMGTNIHLVEGGDADKEISLMAKAGLGLARDAFRWYKYEKNTKGEYVLPETWKVLLEKIDEYGLSMLPVIAGYSSLYRAPNIAHHNDAFPVTDDALDGFKNYVKAFLKEPLVQNACEMVEIWNEPEIIRFLDGAEIERDPATNKPTASEYARLGAAYADVLKVAYQGVAEAEEELNDKDYQVGGFCFTQGVNYTGFKNASALFTDHALAGVADGEYFDYVTKHSYSPGSDAEIGHYGGKIKSYAPAYHINFGINWIRGLMNGTKTAYDYTTCGVGEDAGDIGKTSSLSLSGGTKWDPQWITPKVTFEGATGNQNYDFDYQKAMWHTETGWSTAISTDGRATNGDEWKQGINLVRIYNVIMGNNLPGNYQWSASETTAPTPIERDKVWFYEFIDGGTSIGAVEENWGMLKADNSENPYAAKYSYIMIAAMNNIIGAKGEIVDYTEKISNTVSATSNFNHIAEYNNEETGRRTFMLWTTNKYAQDTTNTNFKENVASSVISKIDAGLSGYSNIKYFDILGNPIAESDVLTNGSYKLTETPFYAVVDTKTISDKEYSGKTEIWLGSDGIGISGGTLSNISGDYIVNFNPELVGGSYIVMGALYQDGRLVDIKFDEGTVLKSGIIEDKLEFSVDSGYDEIRFFLWDGTRKIIPLGNNKKIKIN